ncbi:MAG: hypothetical protein FWH08_07275 [Oscillospiraceae bacterium]|nr:hypothetical protein [Oscillospiraceae bacterium]
MEDRFDKIFESVVIKYHEMRLYRYNDAIRVIDECEKRRIKILGVDSFRLLPNKKIQPFMEFSHDYSALAIPLTWNKARGDICLYSQKDLVFEIVY